MDRLDERGPFACHDHVNGVEVFFTAKTPGQVGCWICGRLKLAAKGTEESKLAVADLGRHVQPILDQDMDGDVIAQLKQLVLGKSFHGSSLPECLSGAWVVIAGLKQSVCPHGRYQWHMPIGKDIASYFAITTKR
jgi:hypothetical protein